MALRSSRDDSLISLDFALVAPISTFHVNDMQRYARTLLSLVIAGTLVTGLFILGPSPAHAQEPTETPTPTAESDSAKGAPYVPTPEHIVLQMLELADVSSEDVVYDLGSGDGRIVIAAARDFGARGVGIEIDHELIKQARQNAEAAGVADRVEFRQGDLFETDLSDATVVTLYLWPDMNNRLRPKLQAELDPGDRVVSHSFDIDGWTSDTTSRLEDHSVGDFPKTIFRWTVSDSTAQE